MATHLCNWLLVASLATILPPQSASSEQNIRTLTEAYGRAIGANDLTRIRELWDPHSPNLASRLRAYEAEFADARYEIMRMSVSRLQVNGDKAISYLTSDERRLDKLTGVVITEHGAFHGICRSLEWIKTSDGWKIERESILQDELAARYENATSDSEREKLLEQESAVVTDAFLGALGARGWRHYRRGEYEKGRHCFVLLEALANKMGDKLMVASALLRLGLIDRVQDDPYSALLMEQKAVSLYRAAGNDSGTANSLRNMASAFREIGNYSRAFECIQEALRLTEKARDSRATAEALRVLALIYSDQNNDQQALAQLERSYALYQQLGSRLQVAVVRHLMARAYGSLGNYERAREFYEELLKQTESAGDLGGAAILLSDIGDTWSEERRHAEALEYYRRALSRSEAARFRGETAHALRRIGQAYQAVGDYQEALVWIQKAVALEREMDRPNSLGAALTALGYCRLELSQTLEARQAFAEAISITEKLRAQAGGGVEESQRFLEGRLRAYHGMLSLLVKENQSDEALAIAELTKARVLLDVLENGRVNIQKAMTTDELEQERRLKSALTATNRRLAGASQSDKPDTPRINELKQEVEKARLGYEAHQVFLYAAHPQLKVQRGQAPIITPQELLSLLPDTSTALLEYVVTDEKTYLFAITRGAGRPDIHLYTLPIKSFELAKEIEAFRQQLAGRDLGFRAAAAKLYALLIKPAQAELKGKSNLVIVPDDSVWDLSFQALLSAPNQFLIEDATIAYAPSLTVLRDMIERRQQHKASATVLAIGNPAISAKSIERAGMALRDEKIPPLPESEREVTALGQLYGASRSKIYVGPNAREGRIKIEAENAGILHFATHGILNNITPMYSHLLLAHGSPDEDGLLEAWELMQLNLKAELVVLSACETARGRYGAGEGVIGLTWALFVAGVPTTVVSQWKVEAASTRDLMVSFHRPLASGAKTNKAEALRQAQLRLRGKPETRHPFYWAGFVLVGDGF